LTCHVWSRTLYCRLRGASPLSVHCERLVWKVSTRYLCMVTETLCAQVHGLSRRLGCGRAPTCLRAARLIISRDNPRNYVGPVWCGQGCFGMYFTPPFCITNILVLAIHPSFSTRRHLRVTGPGPLAPAYQGYIQGSSRCLGQTVSN
jgi:hypothetical protein